MTKPQRKDGSVHGTLSARVRRGARVVPLLRLRPRPPGRTPPAACDARARGGAARGRRSARPLSRGEGGYPAPRPPRRHDPIRQPAPAGRVYQPPPPPQPIAPFFRPSLTRAGRKLPASGGI